MGSFVFLDQFPYPLQKRSLWVILIVAYLLDLRLEQLPKASNYPLPGTPVRRIRNLGVRRKDWPEICRRAGQQLLDVVG